MSTEKQQVSIPCPNCKKDIDITFHDMIIRKAAKCRRCKTSYAFKSTDTSRLRSAIRDVDRTQDKFLKTYEKMISNADILFKK